MPRKLLVLILIMSLLLVFFGFNLENRSDVSLVFFTFTNVPVVLTLLVAFLLDLVVAFFISLGRGQHRGTKPPSSANGQASGRQLTAAGDEAFKPEAASVSDPGATPQPVPTPAPVSRRRRGKIQPD